MAWARLDDGFGDHPKVLELIDTLDEMAGAAAVGLWTLGLVYAHRTMRTAKTPGYVPRSFARSARVPATYGDLLCDVGLWEHSDNGGWVIHDFDQYLPSEGLRSARSEAGKRGAAARWGKTAAQSASAAETAGGDSNLPSDATMANGKSCPEPEPEPEVTKKTSSSSKRGTRIPDGFAINDGMAAWCQREYPNLSRYQAEAITAEFVDYWRGVPGAKGTKLDWEATWRNRMRAKLGDPADGSGQSGPPAVRNGYTPRRSTTDERMEQADAALAEVKRLMHGSAA